MSTRHLHATILFVTAGLALACGGLPVDLPDLPLAASPEVEDDAEEPTPLPEPTDLFVFLDGEEAPVGRAPSCPSGTSQVKYPRGGNLEIYCASHSGKKEGPWTRWRGSRLLETRTYAAGQQDGPATRWDSGRKVEESTWVSDIQHGNYAAWSAEGALTARGMYVDGQRHGRFIELGEDGTFGGACYTGGTEAWRTEDPEAFVTDPCGEVEPEA